MLSFDWQPCFCFVYVCMDITSVLKYLPGKIAIGSILKTRSLLVFCSFCSNHNAWLNSTELNQSYSILKFSELCDWLKTFWSVCIFSWVQLERIVSLITSQAWSHRRRHCDQAYDSIQLNPTGELGPIELSWVLSQFGAVIEPLVKWKVKRSPLRLFRPSFNCNDILL